MEKETILKAAEYCANENVEHCGCCPLNEMSMNCGYYFAKYLADKELEPAPAGTETSPKNKNSHFDNNTISEICQAPECESAQEYSNFMLGLVTNAFGKADVGTLIADKSYCSVDFKFNGRDCCLSFRMETPNGDQN